MYVPGPWHVESKEYPYVLDDQSRIIATTRMEQAEFTPEGKTDAYLIASAPDLLKAAIRVIDYVPYLEELGQHGHIDYTALKTAIQKATEVK